MDLASAYVLRLSNRLVLDFEVHGRWSMKSGSLEYSGLESDREDSESKRGQDLVANLVDI